MTKQQGFTLIELVMVIVILGILSAFALPRFADLGDEAKRATLQGARGAVQSASAIAHAKALASGETGESATISFEGQDVTMAWGYPTADAAGIGEAAQLSDEFTLAGGTISLDGFGCSFTYAAATEGSAATVSKLVNADSGECD